MHQSLFSGKKFDKGSKIHNPSDGTVVPFADLRLFDQASDSGLGFLGHCLFPRVYGYGAVVLHVDRSPRLLGYPLDHLSPGADYGSYFIGVDLQVDDLRCELRDAVSGLLDGLIHDIQDV